MWWHGISQAIELFVLLEDQLYSPITNKHSEGWIIKYIPFRVLHEDWVQVLDAQSILAVHYSWLYAFSHLNVIFLWIDRTQTKFYTISWLKNNPHCGTHCQPSRSSWQLGRPSKKTTDTHYIMMLSMMVLISSRGTMFGLIRSQVISLCPVSVSINTCMMRCWYVGLRFIPIILQVWVHQGSMGWHRRASKWMCSGQPKCKKLAGWS